MASTCYRSLFILFLTLTIKAEAQPAYSIQFRELKTYEGTYEYKNHSTLQIAASPVDTMLYALIGDARYRLRPYKTDIFLNSGKQEVQFVRKGTSIIGYKVTNDTLLYQLVSRNVTFSDKMWYARSPGKPFVYHYKIPAETRDGLPTGSIVHSGLDTALMRKLINRIVGGSYPNVHSILIVKDGKLILEEYFYEYDAGTLHQLRSATKTFASALVGIAIDKGLIKSVEDRVIPYFPEYSILNLDARKEAITIKNLLTQESGLACNDDDPGSPGNETKIYPTDDWANSILNLPMEESPGHKGSYCSGNIILLDRIVEKSSHQSLHDFAAQNLFGKLGITDFKWDFVPDKSHEDDFGQVNLKPRDMAKFGLVYLNGGQWKGTQIISANWVSQSLSKHSTVRGIDYGYLWWREPLTANGVVYEGMAAKGNGGQRIFIWPDQNMVAVITAGNYNAQSPANKLLIECVLGGLKK
jgi:CubicO group peptidase (beta-lactamase class C family)